VMVVISITTLVSGCGEVDRSVRGSVSLAPVEDLGITVGSVADVLLPDVIPVQGYSLVAGLAGTGSAECPAQLRAYLSRYIITQTGDSRVDIDKLISSQNTAIVRVEGMIPAVAARNEHFDVIVTALPGTQTTSLENGWLYRTELQPTVSAGIATQVIASAEGPIFVDKISTNEQSRRLGYVLGGGEVLQEYRMSLILSRPDYSIASHIRNRINESFRYETAKAMSPGRITLEVPAKYHNRKARFVEIVKAIYLDHAPAVTQERIKTFVRKLAVSEDKDASEIALEAIGSKSLSKLGVLLNSSNEEVRLRAARCMLNLGSDRGLQTLREIVLDTGSSYRVEALEAIAAGAKRDDTTAISRKMLRDSDFNVRLAAYEQLQKLEDLAITQKFVGRSFFLELVPQTEHKTIYVTRSGQPRVVLFGAPIYCRNNIFVESSDGNIIIDSRATDEYVSVTCRHPTKPIVIGPLKSSFKLSDIIQILCEEPIREDKQRGGLGISYADMIALLKRMSDKGAIEAEFRVGPLTEMSFGVKK